MIIHSVQYQKPKLRLSHDALGKYHLSEATTGSAHIANCTNLDLLSCVELGVEHNMFDEKVDEVFGLEFSASWGKNKKQNKQKPMFHPFDNLK